jgi:hypothetical protein
MAAMANILVKDDSNPLVEFTLVPVTNNRPKWRTQLTGVPVNGQITAEQLVNEQLGSGDWKRVMKVEVPVMETLGTAGTSAGYQAAPKVAYVEKWTVSKIAPARSVLADAANSLKIVIGLLAGAGSASGAGTLDGTSAADAVKGHAGPMVRFFVAGEDAF